MKDEKIMLFGGRRIGQKHVAIALLISERDQYRAECMLLRDEKAQLESENNALREKGADTYFEYAKLQKDAELMREALRCLIWGDKLCDVDLYPEDRDKLEAVRSVIGI